MPSAAALCEGGSAMDTSASTSASRRGESSGGSSLPLAIAVLGLEPATSDEARRLLRVDLALIAYGMGYFLLDIVEVTAGEGPAGYAWIETLAQRTDAEALVISGMVDRALLETIADDNRMAVRTV